MSSKLDFTIDVGSSKLRLAITQKTNKFNKVLSLIEKEYDGFSDSEFFNPLSVKFIVTDLITEAVKRTGAKVDNVYVGVPSEFCFCVCKRISSTFPKAKKISQSFVDAFLARGGDLNSEKFTLINYSPMKFTLDGNIDVVKPVGHKTINISADCSYILAKRDFIVLFDEALHSAGVKSITYLSTALAQSQLLCEEPQLESTIIVDVGHITTSVSISKGEGLVLLSSFSLGGGHISADLMQLLKLSYEDADLIKRKAILTIKPERNERYEIKNNEQNISALIQITNEIICSRIENIGQLINNLLKIDPAYSQLPVYLTGEGLNNIKGARQVLSRTINHKVIPFGVENNERLSKYQTSIEGLTKLVTKLK